MKITDIQPTKGHVLVELPPATTEVNGIILAGDQTNNAPVRGTIIRIPETGSPFGVGEVIFFRKYAIDELNFTEEDMSTTKVFIVDEREILGVIRPIEEVVEVKTEVMRAETRDSDRILKASLN